MARSVQSEEVILEVAATVLGHARLHTSALSEFGINPALLQVFENEINEAKAMPREIANREQLKEQTRSKKAVLESCYDWGIRSKTRIEMAFGKKSDEALSFPTKELRRGRTNERVMLGIFEMIIGLAGKYQAELAPYGQTAEFLARGSELSLQLRTANEAQELQKKDKLAATKTRKQKFQALYATVNQICKAGRIVFKNDPARLVLFQRPWPGAKTTMRETETDTPETSAE